MTGRKMQPWAPWDLNLPNTWVLKMVAILHRPSAEGTHCDECPAQSWPCRTVKLASIGREMDGMGWVVDED